MAGGTYSFEDCPHCGAVIEVYDRPTSVMWSNHCDNCGWTDRLEYYESKDGYTIYKLTREEAETIKDELFQPPHGLTAQELAQRLAKYDKANPGKLKNAKTQPPK